MKLTDEQIGQILEKAPDEAVFFDGDDYSNIHGLVWDKHREEYYDCGHFVCGDNLDLYREILTLRQHVPDVSVLVEALQAISRNELDAQRAQYFASIALAAYRKQGDDL